MKPKKLAMLIGATSVALVSCNSGGSSEVASSRGSTVSRSTQQVTPAAETATDGINLL